MVRRLVVCDDPAINGWTTPEAPIRPGGGAELGRMVDVVTALKGRLCQPRVTTLGDED